MFQVRVLLSSHLSVEITCCHVLLPIASACSLAATYHPSCPVQCLMGSADSASTEKGNGSNGAEKQLLHDDLKRLRREKVLPNG